ncbi:MAG TPA: hypothetical protein VGS79_00900 [Puia sp.]|nr:hypothetical protein [Puia sp.]
MKFIGILTRTCWMAVVVLIVGCDEGERKDISSYLGIVVPPTASHIKVFKDQLDPDYKRPYNIYITFSLDSISVMDMIYKAGLIEKEDDYKQKMCLKNADSLFIENLWKFKTKYGLEASVDFKKDVWWWNPESDQLLLFASFYKEDGKKKIEPCYLKHWDGRVLLGYDRIKGMAYILIEVFM